MKMRHLVRLNITIVINQIFDRVNKYENFNFTTGLFSDDKTTCGARTIFGYFRNPENIRISFQTIGYPNSQGFENAVKNYVLVRWSNYVHIGMFELTNWKNSSYFSY
ncbi:MAG: hypothetical protein LBB45_03530 [Methanobrevibacter sp.]|jgi:hypothetical protein|nr:hypothetical protein [Candidatus Methanovirga basalitermitum]